MEQVGDKRQFKSDGGLGAFQAFVPIFGNILNLNRGKNRLARLCLLRLSIRRNSW